MGDMSEMYLVLIGDIRNSRALDEIKRCQVQENLEDLFNDIKEESETYVSPPTITLGDEFQVVYRNADSIFHHMWQIQAAIAPIMMRFSIGCGDISTKLNKSQALGMDGPAFHVARAGLDYLKEKDEKFRFECEDLDPIQLELINYSMGMVAHEMKTWNARRFVILYLYIKGFDYKAIAQQVDISTMAYYKNVEAGALEKIVGLGDSITRILNEQIK